MLRPLWRGPSCAGGECLTSEDPSFLRASVSCRLAGVKRTASLKSTPEAPQKLAQRANAGNNSEARPSAVGATPANFIRALNRYGVRGGWSRWKRGQKKRGAWQTHTRLLTNKSIFRVPQGSPPYRHKMSIPYYKSSSADPVKPAQLTLSHQQSGRR